MCAIATLVCALAIRSAPTSQAVEVRKFVQSFYDWYTPKASSAKLKDLPYYVAIRAKPELFTPRLLRALKADHQAWVHAKDDPEGIDFDPFMNSQDPDLRYLAGKVRLKAGFYYVELLPIREGVRLKKAVIVAKVEGRRGRWRFANFIQPRFGWDLLSLLERLEADRKKRLIRRGSPR